MNGMEINGNIYLKIGSLVFIVLIVYNLIPFLIYLIKQYLKQKTAKRLVSDSVSSPWVRIASIKKNEILDNSSTVSELFIKATKKYKNKECFGCRFVESEEEVKQSDGKLFKKLVLSDYKWFTYEQINQRIDFVAKGLLHIGVKPKEIVMIYAETRLEWVISCQSLLRSGVTVATLYTTLSEEGVVHGINETEVKYLITNFELLNKLKPILPKLTKLEFIVYIDDYKQQKIKDFKEESQKIRVFSLRQIEELGKSHPGLKCVEPKEEDIAVLMYTSGSTGNPKGVMISHKNFLTAVRAFNTLNHHLISGDIYIAYLPLAHIMEMSSELFFICNGVPVGFGTTLTLTDKSPALQKGVRGDVSLLQPTIMVCVPLILDRIRKVINEEIAKKHLLSRILINILFYTKLFWFKRGIYTPIIDFIFCRKFTPILGGRVRIIPCGGAPLSKETHDFIRGFFNIHLIQGYGLTETSASATLMDCDDSSVGFVGPPLEGIQIKLIDWEEGNYRINDKPNSRGEVVIGGKSISKGYFKNEKLTQESYKEENDMKWFFTGDIGEIDKSGSLKIIDRKKDIIKLSTGEYITLAKIEEELKKDPFVENICVYGNSEKDYLIALIVPNRKQLELLSQKLSKDNLSFKELCSDSDLNQKVLESIKETSKANKLLKVEIPHKIHLCSDEWLPENGLVTAALKLRRKNIQEFYQKDIDRMYSNQ